MEGSHKIWVNNKRTFCKLLKNLENKKKLYTKSVE